MSNTPAQVISKQFQNAQGSSTHAASKKMMRLLAAPLLSQMGLTRDVTAPVQFLDNACGTGVMTQEMQVILSRDVLEKSEFVCTDSSAAMIDAVKGRIGTEGWVNVLARVADAMDTGLPESAYSHVAVGLGLHLIPRPDDVLKDCQRVLKDGGIFGATTFPTRNRDIFWGPDIRAAFDSMPFKAPYPEDFPVQTHSSGKWYDEDWVAGHMKEKGFKDVRVTVNPGKYFVENVQEFVDFFGGMIAFLVNAWWSEELKRQHGVEEVKGLVRDFLEKKYGDEGWEITWEVISVTGRVEK
ncbi:hypothetical protein QQS21_000154 [Conoideocrella luteorostrata]|uniref:Methyltransferase domain-containing protein n=1 Tax=Conoideocrella luteorostrata TaxID=1105319 RepID=A0AAJ0G2N1_9HYPO|nr:hypothetical protein QQS21_000154 [Conoideocrella luteorostrata]